MLEIHRSLAPDTVDYLDGWEQQRRWHAEVSAGERPDTLWLLEHNSVFTAGKRTEADERPTDGTPVIDVDRGGKLTWHGPGQLTGYPIFRLPEPIDVVAFVRRLEAIIIDAIAEFGVVGERVEGRSGVWVKTVDGPLGASYDKVGAIGLRVKDGVTMHGFAINCTNSLEPYSRFVACGIRDAGVTTLSLVAGRAITPAEVAEVVAARFLAEDVAEDAAVRTAEAVPA